jgi:hypothetical protein
VTSRACCRGLHLLPSLVTLVESWRLVDPQVWHMFGYFYRSAMKLLDWLRNYTGHGKTLWFSNWAINHTTHIFLHIINFYATLWYLNKHLECGGSKEFAPSLEIWGLSIFRYFLAIYVCFQNGSPWECSFPMI